MTKVSPNPRTLRRQGEVLTSSQKTMIAITVISLLVFYGLFFIFPICYAFVGSFHDWMPMKGKFEFVGLENYLKVLKHSTTATAMGNTLLFTVVVTAARTVLGLIFAVLIHEFNSAKALFRTVYFLPVVTSTVAVSVVWKWLFEPTNGPFNYYITAMGFPSQLFLKDAGSALWCIMLMTVWKDMGYAMVVYMAGLTNISPSLYESASIDGSNRLQSFWYITLPMLKSTTAFVLLTSFVSYCQTFTQIDLMTEGGPGKATYTMVYMLYQEAFSNYRFGRASAIAFLLFAVIFVVSLVQLRLNRSEGDR